MRILYFDCFNGASGDMILGACLDAGLPLGELRAALGSLGLRDYELRAERVLRAGVSATKFRLDERTPSGGDGHGARPGHSRAPELGHEHRDARSDAPSRAHEQSHQHATAARSPAQGHTHAASHELSPAPAHSGEPGEGHAHPPSNGPAHSHPHEHAGVALQPHRSLPDIEALIGQSSLSPAGRARAVALFRRLAEAEARIHQMPVEQVHLHEVGALDSIIDIVGAVFAFEWFAADRVIVSPLNVGSGMVRSAHGVFPVPAPATVALLGDAPVYSRGPEAELVTPTGALLLTGHASAFGPIPLMRIARAGYGAGDKDFPDTPNVLRLLVGDALDVGPVERIVVLECEIDDMNPQIFGSLMDQLYAAGALEVFYQPVQMKKNRPGTLVTVIAPPERRAALSSLVFRETTTIGIRYQEMQRERLDREMVSIETPYGPVRFKIARHEGAVVNAAPEFDDCAVLATARGVPVKDVQAAAVAAWRSRGAT